MIELRGRLCGGDGRAVARNRRRLVYKWRATGEEPSGMCLAKWQRFLEGDIMAWLETRRDPI
jgi:hypothetical protein